MLDIAAGSGNVAIPAARTGARVIASDLTPELLEEGARQAAAAGVVLEWQVADAEHLPYDDDEFDVAVSASASCSPRTTRRPPTSWSASSRPAAASALASWTPQGFIGQMFATMKPYVAAAARRRLSPPPLWGDEDHVRALLGDRVTDLRFRATQGPGHPLRRAGRLPRVLQDQLRADDRGVQPAAGRRSARPPSTPTSTRSPSASTSATPATWCWTGSTCWSPAEPPDPTHRFVCGLPQLLPLGPQTNRCPLVV